MYIRVVLWLRLGRVIPRVILSERVPGSILFVLLLFFFYSHGFYSFSFLLDTRLMNVLSGSELALTSACAFSCSYQAFPES